jgi:hypothetical protein
MLERMSLCAVQPLCPYSRHAHYKGDGDAQDAMSFECRDGS